MKTSVTLKDVASILNISVSTVSKALSDSPEISDNTKRKVIQTANSLDYKPNIHASALRNNKSFILGVILPDLQEHFFLDCLNGITEESYKHDYKIMVYQTCNDYKKEIEYSNLLLNSNIIDGLIFSPIKKSVQLLEHDPLSAFKNKNVPITYLKKHHKISVNSCPKQVGFKTGSNSVKELLSKIKNLDLDISA